MDNININLTAQVSAADIWSAITENVHVVATTAAEQALDLVIEDTVERAVEHHVEQIDVYSTARDAAQDVIDNLDWSDTLSTVDWGYVLDLDEHIANHLESTDNTQNFKDVDALCKQQQEEINTLNVALGNLQREMRELKDVLHVVAGLVGRL